MIDIDDDGEAWCHDFEAHKMTHELRRATVSPPPEILRTSNGTVVERKAPDARSYDERSLDAALLTCAGCGVAYYVKNPLSDPWRCWRCACG